MRLVGIVVVVWLLIGVFATFQRGYFEKTETNCATAGTIALTVLVGGGQPESGGLQPAPAESVIFCQHL